MAQGVEELLHPYDAKTSSPCAQVCILDGRLYAELESEQPSDTALDECVLLAGNQGKELLAPGPDEDYSDDRKIVIQLQDGRVRLAMQAKAERVFPGFWSLQASLMRGGP